jgi:hypothetical protein
MYRLALLMLIGALAVVHADHCCSAGDRHVVQKQWSELFENQDAKFRAGVARLLLLRVIQDYPDAKALFANVDVDHPTGGAFTAHSMRIFNAFDMTINLLDDEDSLNEALDHLADQHEGRAGVKRDYFKSFGQAVHRGLPKILDNYDYMAWKQCAGYILEVIASKLHA